MARGRTIYDTREWRRVRLVVLARDGYVCRIGYVGTCRVTATSVDHVTRPEDGGALFDPHNLQAACVPCNSAKRNRQIAKRAKRADRVRRSQVQAW